MDLALLGIGGAEALLLLSFFLGGSGPLEVWASFSGLWVSCVVGRDNGFVIFLQLLLLLPMGSGSLFAISGVLESQID